jgi:hydroxyacid-oxoacid transhydrogenase
MAITRIAPSRATRALNLLRTINSTHSACPCHSNPGHHHNHNPYAGCTKEVGMDFRHLGAKKVLVVTDSTVLKLDAMKQVVEGLEREGIPYEVYSKTRVEPKDYS